MPKDIGDHQSIQESLSTFSAPTSAAIRNMLERATAGSLVLIDELGRATDPEEGGALGVAVLDADPKARRVHDRLDAFDGAEGLWSFHAGHRRWVD